jgi:hypothetical protein
MTYDVSKINIVVCVSMLPQFETLPLLKKIVILFMISMQYDYTLGYLHSMILLTRRVLLENFEEEVCKSIARCGQLVEDFQVRHCLK